MNRFILLCFACTLTTSLNAQSMKIVVDADNAPIGRYLRETATSYVVEIQDAVEWPKKGCKVVTYRAEDGQGILYMKVIGTVNVRQQPSTSSKIIAKISYSPEDGIPEDYNCLGKVNGWYKIKVDGKIGYVRQDLLEWDGICTF